MFTNIGSKIKALARAICVLGIGLSVLAGLILIVNGAAYNTALVGTGFLVLFAGSLSAWLGSLFAYGFGELIENTTVIAELAAKADAEKSAAASGEPEKDENNDKEEPIS